MKKIKKKLILFLLLMIFLFPYKIKAVTVTCSKINDSVTQYQEIEEELNNLDCTTTTDEDVVKACNSYNTEKALLLSKLYKFNDMKKCDNKDLDTILEENKDNCSNVLGTRLKTIKNYMITAFYLIGPFLFIIFGSTDLFSIVTTSDLNREDFKQSSTPLYKNTKSPLGRARRRFFYRLIALLLLFLVPMFINILVNFSTYSLTGDVYSCKAGYTFFMNRWDVTYIPPVNTPSKSASNGSVTLNGKWHTDWFQGDDRWGGHAWDGGSGSIAEGGCGSLATSIVCAHYYGDDSESSFCYPYNTADEYYKNNLQPNLSRNAITTFFNEWHPNVGVTVTLREGDIDVNELDSVLADGGCVIADFQGSNNGGPSYQGTSVWTSPNGGHYVTITGGNQKDGYRVADSNGGHNSGYSGVSAWAPYGEHVFEKEYVVNPWYYYIIELN